METVIKTLQTKEVYFKMVFSPEFYESSQKS